MSFDDANSYIIHLRNLHSLIYKSNKFICICNRNFNRVESFRKHINRVHMSNVEQNVEPFTEVEEVLDTRNDTTELQSSSCLIRRNFKLEMLKYALKLYSDESLPRNKALEIIKETYNRLKKICSEMKDHFRKGLVSLDISLETINEIFFIFDDFCNEKFSKTEYLILKEFIDNNLLILARDIVLSSNLVPNFVNNAEVLKTNNFFFKLIPLKEIFDRLFNLPNFIQDIVSYVNSIKNNEGLVMNFVQCQFWKDKIKNLENTDTLLLPLFVYFDDFEPLNPLGSHSGDYKIGAVYLKIPCLPPHLQSKVEHIYLGQLFFSGDRVTFGNSRLFYFLIQELNELQEIGVKVNFQNYSSVKLITVLVLGDNLGTNSILGFAEGFNANYYCRFCRSHKKQMQLQCEENYSSVRSEQNYLLDVNLGNVSLTGVNENSIFNQITNFHVTNNPSVDIMHDLLEGVCHYDLTQIITYFIHTKKYFSLDLINKRILCNNYGHLSANKPGPITDGMLIKKKLKYSASEMYSFTINLSAIIGDLVPRDDECWSLYVILRQILSIVMSDVISEQMCDVLFDLIQVHHQTYIKFFGDLKPKFHFMVHYPRIQKLIGSLKGIWSMRFESNHRFFKKIANNVSSRKNLLHTFCIKNQLQMANLFANFESQISNYKCGPLSEISLNSLQKYGISSIDNTLMHTTKWVEVNSVVLKPETVIEYERYDDGSPQFAIVNSIIVTNDKVLLCVQVLLDFGFDDHFQAYIVDLENSYFSVELNLENFYKIYYIQKINKNIKMVNYAI